MLLVGLAGVELAKHVFDLWKGHVAVALLDEIGALIRKRLGRSREDLPLAKVLEGGSWAAGRQIANWLVANASTLGIDNVIFEQKIWSVARAREGWRGMSNRGSATANHYDHVHVRVR